MKSNPIIGHIRNEVLSVRVRLGLWEEMNAFKFRPGYFFFSSMQEGRSRTIPMQIERVVSNY